VREAAVGVADLAIGQHYVRFRFARDGIDGVYGTESDRNVGQVMWMKKRGFVPGKTEAENAYIGILKYKTMMRLFRHRHWLR